MGNHGTFEKSYPHVSTINVDPQLHSRFWKNSGFSHGSPSLAHVALRHLRADVVYLWTIFKYVLDFVLYVFELFRTVRSTKNHRFSHWKTSSFVPFHPIPDPWHSPAPPPPWQISVTALGPLHGIPELYILRQATQQGSPALLMTSSGITWRLIPLSKWVITAVISGLTLHFQCK